MGKIISYFVILAMLSSIATIPVSADNSVSAKNICLAPFSLVSGCLIGTPIAAARLSKKSYTQLMSALSDDNTSYKFWGRQCAFLLALPIGAMKGCYYGPKNAITNCSEKPFSKDSFSLSDLP